MGFTLEAKAHHEVIPTTLQIQIIFHNLLTK